MTGQYLKDDTEPVAIVADLSEVWIAAQVKEKDIRFINAGSSLDIEVSALPGMVIKGNVYHVEEAVDEDTRSIKVLSVCDNSKKHLKLGMYTTVHFLSAPIEQVQISESALLQGERQLCVCAGYSGYLCKNTGEGRSDQRWICCDK